MDKKDKICIIAVGYNRPHSMNRLLNSLSNSKYEEEVDLLISIDKGKRQSEIKEIADEFVWNFGNKHVRAFSERQGLRSHIIQCGDMTKEYRAVIVLEDDITVAEGFFSYVRQCIEQYESNDSIAGISLYKHYINVGSMNFFEPAYNGYDVFFMQFAQSWGQCWTKKMWEGFKEWYLKNLDVYFMPENESLIKIPDNVISWDSHSWLKYYIAYTVESNKFFVYPYHSLTTNHSETGQHSDNNSNAYMVSLQEGIIKYRFPDNDKAIKYDVFFERVDMNIQTYEGKNVILDLYGNKKDFIDGDILFSSAAHPYRVIDTLQLKHRPHEYNCVFMEKGQGIFVYDLKTAAKPPKHFNNRIRTIYDVRTLSWKKLLQVGLDGISGAIKRRIKK